MTVRAKSAAAIAAIWTTGAPAAWPDPPRRMSYTLLRDIEACPLRWALRRGEYPDVWAGEGYPSAPPLATLAGQIVHGALERILRAVGRSSNDRSGSISTQTSDDPLARVVAALRALGGITAVLESLLTDIVRDWTGNPRLAPRAREWESELRRQLPALRLRVQQLLSQVQVGNVASMVVKSEPVPSNADLHEGESVPRALAPGIYAEVPLNDLELSWYGKADLLRLEPQGGNGDTPGECEIVDFKTGEPKEDHSLQLRIYALLWARDRRLNPGGKLASRLTLIYQTGALSVPPPTDDAELSALSAQLRERSTGAQATVGDNPPEARPSKVPCEWCDVRHMCRAYWEPATRSAMTNSVESGLPPSAPPTSALGGTADVELSILKEQGVWSWLGRVTATGALAVEIPKDSVVLVRARAHDAHFRRFFSDGTRVRVIAGQYLSPTEESGGLPVIALTRSTEAFVVSSSAPKNGANQQMEV